MPGKNAKNKNKRKSKRWQKLKRKEDAVMEDARPTDLVIPLMGPTGVGKSTFINKYFNDTKAQVGNTLTSCTQTLAWYTADLQEGPFEGRRLVLVDTPGFDDTNENDSEILRRIAVWLAASYSSDMSLAGVLYLHDIGQKRMLGSTRMNLNMFESLVGIHRKGEFPTIALVTTQWDTVREDAGARREEELKQVFWKDAISQGASVYRASEGAHASIIQDILRKTKATEDENTTMLIQHELVDKERPIPLTEAGQKLRYDLADLLKHQAQIAKNAKDDEKRQETERKMAAIQAQKNALHVSFKDRVSHLLRTAMPGN